VKARDARIELINYYRKIVSINISRKKDLESIVSKKEDVDRLWGGHLGIAMASLPKGLTSQAAVTVDIAKKPEKRG